MCTGRVLLQLIALCLCVDTLPLNAAVLPLAFRVLFMIILHHFSDRIVSHGLACL
jgi:hypothetical protein